MTLTAHAHREDDDGNEIEYTLLFRWTPVRPERCAGPVDTYEPASGGVDPIQYLRNRQPVDDVPQDVRWELEAEAYEIGRSYEPDYEYA